MKISLINLVVIFLKWLENRNLSKDKDVELVEGEITEYKADFDD